jgi:alpha-D-xyloside xylohydrolase
MKPFFLMPSANAAIFLACLSVFTSVLHAAPPTLDRQPDGMTVHLDSGDLRIQVLSDTVVRVAFSKSSGFFSHASIDVVPHPSFTTGWKISEKTTAFTLSTSRIQVNVDRQNGAVSFADANGHPVLSETPRSRTVDPATVQGESSFHIQQKWKMQPDESLYGLGQMQLGIVDIKGYDLDLLQHNTNVVVPFLVSSKGYGILWDNTSFTRFGDLRSFEAIPAASLYDASGRQGDLTVAPWMAPRRTGKPQIFPPTCS